MKVFILAIGDIRTPSTRFRILNIFKELEKNSIRSKIVYFNYNLNVKQRKEIIEQCSFLLKEYDLLILHRVLLKKSELKKLCQDIKIPVIFDFDDALYATPSKSLVGNFSKKELSIKSIEWMKRPFRKLLLGNIQFSRRKWLLDITLNHVDCIVAGNKVLESYARNFTNEVQIIPTVVDTGIIPAKVHVEKTAPIIGWIGTKDNIYYLNQLRSVFKILQFKNKQSFILRIVSSSCLDWKDPWLQFKCWKAEEELDDLMNFDIGIMPISNDEWSKGKCAFKAIYCSAASLPVVASNIGANKEIVLHNRTGYLASNSEEWVNYLNKLLANANLRQRMGAAGRKWIQKNYSLNKSCSKWQTLLDEYLK